MIRASIVSLSILIGGCASVPVSHETPPTLPRAKPVQAMGAPNVDGLVRACKFRPTFRNLLLDEQLAMIRNCLEITGDVLWKTIEKNRRLVEWINDESAAVRPVQ